MAQVNVDSPGATCGQPGAPAVCVRPPIGEEPVFPEPPRPPKAPTPTPQAPKEPGLIRRIWPWGAAGSGAGLKDSKTPEDTAPTQTPPAPTSEPARPRVEVIQRWDGPGADPLPDTAQKPGPAKKAPAQAPLPEPTPAPKGATAPQTPKVPEVEAAKKQRIPKWRQDCITAFSDCKYQKWSGNCFACFELCMGEHEWPKEKCPAPLETK